MMILKNRFLLSFILICLNIILIQSYCIPNGVSNCLFQHSSIEFGAPFLITTTIGYSQHETKTDIQTTSKILTSIHPTDSSSFSKTTEVVSKYSTISTTFTLPPTTTSTETTISTTITTSTLRVLTTSTWLTTLPTIATTTLTTTTTMPTKAPSNYVRRGQYRIQLPNGTYIVEHFIWANSNYQDTSNQLHQPFNISLTNLKTLRVYSGTYVNAIELFYLNEDVNVYGNTNNNDI